MLKDREPIAVVTDKEGRRTSFYAAPKGQLRTEFDLIEKELRDTVGGGFDMSISPDETGRAFAIGVSLRNPSPEAPSTEA